ncbi:hypothetical protein ACIA8C_19765 [Nocardia sp. NPDC051321]|uniref:hypothetical protein n=1 Tax=Nocardia sp. NPDC051321 TaxID=3364323 RepID=UPI003794384D
MRIKHITLAGLFAAASVAQILGSASATADTPTDCTSHLVGRGAMATCVNPNGGSFRATAVCVSFDGTQIIPRTAPIWMQDEPSMVTCPEFTVETNAGIETRDY